MSVIERVASSDFMQDWKEDPAMQYVLAPALTAVAFMFVVMALDVFTPMATWLWAALWVSAPIVTALLPNITGYKGLGKVSPAARQCIQTYLSLSKDDKVLLPPNTLELLKLDDYNIRSQFEKALIDLRALNEVKDGRVADGFEAMEAAAEGIAMTRQTYEELGG